jgi:hypothetical protein
VPTKRASQFNEGQIMHCIATYAIGIYQYLSKISSEIQIFNFDTHHRVTPYIRQQDVRICGYFSKPKRERELKHLVINV